MTQLTEELFPTLQNRANLIWQQQEAKEALILGRELEKALPPLTNNPPLFQKYQTLTFQLKWLGLSLMQDGREYTELFRNYFLEGLFMPENDLNGPTQIVALKISSMFGIGVVSFLNEILAALSENTQKIGRETILVFGEKKFSQPTIKNWLLDFIRSTPDKQALNEIAVSDYLFNNANAEKLPLKDKNILGKSLIFFCDWQQLNRQFAALEKQSPPTEAATETPSAGPGERNEFYKTAPTVKESTPLPNILQKTLRQLVQANKDALNQNLTANPIKVADFDQPVRPTIKNWLVDYVKIKGAGHHASLERSDYLFNSPNAKSLSAKERALVAEILRAYDDDLALPINEGDQSILLEKLNIPTKLGAAPRALPRGGQLYGDERSEFYAAASQPQQTSQYREPISQEDLSGPTNQTPPAKPAPRISGNIIDLSDISDK